MKNFKFIVNRNGGCGAHMGKEANTPPCCSKRASRFVWVLVLMLTIGIGQMWGAVGDAITAHGSIADATVYYLAGKATVSKKESTYYSVLESDAASASVTGNATTTKASGTQYTFLIESGTYYLVTPNGYYVEPHGSSNGKLILTAAKKAVTVSTQSSKIRITGTTNTGKSIQKNKNTNANFGSYGNTQNDLTLYVAGYRVIYDANGATGGTVPTDNTVYGDNASATIKANTGTLVKTGYTFAGWNTAANGSGTDVAATGSASKTITAGLRLYAKWTAAAPSYTITPASNNTNYGTVSLSGSVITATPAANCRIASDAYTVTSGTASVERGTGDNINKFTVTPSANCTVRINFEQIPTHTVTWSANGTTTSETYQEGAAITFPNTATGCDGGIFMGWAEATISGTQENAPAYVTSATMGTNDITYYAVFATSSGSGVGRVEVNTTNSGVTGSYSNLTFTVGTTTFKTTDWMKSTNIQAKASKTYSLYNYNAFPGNITSIKVKQTGTDRAVSIHGSNYYSESDAEEAGGTYIEEAITQPSTATTMVFDFTGKAFKYFYLTTPGNAVYMDSIVINYSSTTYSDYRTTCCTKLGQINGSFFWTTHFCPVWPAKHRS